MNKTEDKHTYHHGNLKQALIEQSLNMLASSSYEALSLRKLASELGVNQTALYSHFKNKNALLAALAEHGFCQLIEQSHHENKLAHTPDEKLTRFVAYYLNFAQNNSELFKLMFGPLFSHLHPESDTLWAIAEESFALFQEVVNDYLQSVGSDIPDRLATLTVWSFMHGFGHLLIGDRLSEESLQALNQGDLLDHLLSIIKNGLLPRQ